MHNSAVKYLKNFGKIIRIAIANGYITRNPFANIKLRLEEVDRDFLEDHEIRVLIDKKITIERLAQVRDVFVFCCLSGLAFADIKGLEPEHIVRDNNGALWIRKKRQKTGNMCNIPLLDPAREILERYKEHPVCLERGALLPVLCNQKTNAYLREFADIYIITHSERSEESHHRCFATLNMTNTRSFASLRMTRWRFRLQAAFRRLVDALVRG